MAKKREGQKEEGAPAWMVTYGDMMSLLLCFFVMLVAMSEIKADERFEQVMQSLRDAFGYQGGIGAVPTDEPPQLSLLQRLESIVIPRQVKQIGDSDEEGIEGRVYRVTQVREGLEITVGGRITFNRFSAELKPAAEALIAQLADKIRGHTTKIEVRGHTTREPLPEDSQFKDRKDLSYQRAKVVAAALSRHGVDERRIRVTACGATEPLVTQAYTERRRAANRRVGIVVTESVVSEFVGQEENLE